VKRLAIILIYTMMGLTVAAISGYLVVSFMVKNAPEASVPELAGMSLADALDTLNNNGLDLEVRGFVYSDEVAENRVVRQRPGPGEVVKEGRSVGVVLSRGPKKSPVPDVLGMRMEDAAISLSEAGLDFEVGSRVHGGELSTVVGQSREAGTWLQEGEKVSLLLSLGPKPVVYRMPALTGAVLQEAEASLAGLGLVVENVTRVPPPAGGKHNYRSGEVVEQQPLPGFPVVKGSGVRLSVVAGDERGHTAETVLVERYLPPGLTDYSVKIVVSSPGGERLVSEETMPAGSTLRRFVSVEADEEVVVLVDGEEF